MECGQQIGMKQAFILVVLLMSVFEQRMGFLICKMLVEVSRYCKLRNISLRNFRGGSRGGGKTSENFLVFLHLEGK